MKIGCCTTIDYYDDAVAAGFDYIELPGKELASISDGELNCWEQIIKQGSIPCMGLNSSIIPSIKICGPNYCLQATEEYASVLCSRSNRLGVRMIGVGSPASRDVPFGYDPELAWKQTEEFLLILCEKAEKYGITVLWEPLNYSECNFGVDSLESLQHISSLVEKGVNNLGIVCDLYHAVLKNEDGDIIKKMAPYIKHMHIASASDGRRGFITQSDSLVMEPLFRICKNSCDTISAETASGNIRTDGKNCIETLRHWLEGNHTRQVLK